jgi:hypothetical protein
MDAAHVCVNENILGKHEEAIQELKKDTEAVNRELDSLNFLLLGTLTSTIATLVILLLK